MEEKAREIFGARAQFYVTSAIHTERSVLERVVALAEPRPSDLALDVATAAGHTAFAMAPHVRAVVGIDITPQMLAEAAKLRARSGFASVHLAQASVYAMPFTDGAFDVVTCRRAAHHFEDIGRALAEMRRVLRPGGRLVVDDRGVPEDDFVDATMNRLDTLHDASHVREYRQSEWLTMLRSAGFAVEAIEGFTRHRPLTSLTDGATPEDARQVHEIIASLDPVQRQALNVADRDGETYSDHWYLLLSATRQR
jgi:ubiquinone/menaquinone biosynthesis C-methylase UbiE